MEDKEDVDHQEKKESKDKGIEKDQDKGDVEYHEKKKRSDKGKEKEEL